MTRANFSNPMHQMANLGTTPSKLETWLKVEHRSVSTERLDELNLKNKISKKKSFQFRIVTSAAEYQKDERDVTFDAGQGYFSYFTFQVSLTSLMKLLRNRIYTETV